MASADSLGSFADLTTESGGLDSKETSNVKTELEEKSSDNLR